MRQVGTHSVLIGSAPSAEALVYLGANCENVSPERDHLSQYLELPVPAMILESDGMPNER